MLSIASPIVAVRPMSTVIFNGMSVESRGLEGAIAIGIALLALKSH